ncbi:fibronectin type III domain-containing protein [Cohnella hongkongensis]|uniref:Fibronectin type III domain-containing protein n=1 Tax=Cohnella hongkongensis TaxID=178337 RepID=A0ABV9FGJ6_9BACL
MKTKSKSKWKLRSMAGMALAVMLLLSSIPAMPAGAAPTTYYVATNGNDANAGTSGAPFRTIQRAANVAQAGDTVVIRSGTYRETVTPANSGTSGQPIKFQAEAGATVVVSGTEPVTGWTREGTSNIYYANLPSSLGAAEPNRPDARGHQNQVFVVNGSSVSLMWEARWPNLDSAYTFQDLKDNMAFADAGTNGQTIVDQALTQPNGFWNGATVWVRGGHAFMAQTGVVNSYNSATKTFSFTSNLPDYLQPVPGDTYYLSGIKGALDSPNEWFIDSAAGRIYLWAPGGGSPTGVEVKQRLTAFDLSNKSHIHLEGIRTFAANIKMSNAHNNVLDRIHASYLYFSDYMEDWYPVHQDSGGIAISGDNNEIKNSTIFHSTGTLIRINGDNNRIVNNEISEGNYMASYTSLISFDGGEQNLISHNTIRDSGRASIYWKPGSKGTLNVQYNNIYNGMWLSRDGGMIYSYGADLGNSVIHHNLIHDNLAYGAEGTPYENTPSGFNLYLDNFTSNAILHHNVIYAGNTGIAMNTPGNFRLVYNNTVVDMKPGGYSFDYWGEDLYHDELYGTRMFNNILIGNRDDFTSDMVQGNNILTTSGLTFVNAAARNYRLAAGSSAINAGTVINGITGSFSGSAPDAGAYEYGGADWTAGHNFANPPANATFATVSTPGMNLLKNGGFEHGMDHWTGSSTGTTVGVAQSPAWEKRGLFNKLRIGGGVDGVSQTITGLTPNTGYRFVGWVYNDGGEAVNIGVSNYGGSEMSAYSDATSYQRLEVNFTTGPSSTSAQVYIYKSSTGSGYSYGDDFGLIQTTASPSDTQAPSAPTNLAMTAKTDTTVSLSWTASTDNVGVTGYDVYRGATLAGSSTGTTFTATGLSPSTAYTFTVKARDAANNESAASNAVNVTTDAAAALPSPWLTQDVGSVGVAGSAAYAGGAFTVNGAGADIFGTADSFRYVYQPLSGDGEIVARVASVQNTDSNAKAGVMIREALAAGSKHATINLTPGGEAQLLWRDTTNGATSYALGSASAPYWVKLVRSGSTMTASISPNGTSWTEVGSATVAMGTNVYAGLAVLSKNNAALNTSTFDNVSVTGSGGPSDTEAPTAPADLAMTAKTDTTVSLSWTASTDNVDVTGYDVYRDSTLAGSTNGSTTEFTATDLAPNTTYSFTVKARDAANNESTASNAVNVTTNPLPSPWQTQDIGSVGAAGSASHASGTYTVNGAGIDIFGAADSFHYLYQPMSGDGEIIARVASVQNTDTNAKAGVMIRESLTAGSRHAIMNVTPGGEAQMLWRASTDGATNYYLDTASAPYWVRLVRSGDTIAGSISADGSTWTTIGSETVAMGTNVYVGLAVLSKNNAVLNASTFDNVTVTP